MSAASQAFRQALEGSNDFARSFDQPGFPLAEFLHLQEWQRQRFSITYADFVASNTDQAACRFFLQELYGGLGFRQRDEDVHRVEPIMSRLLPDKALQALSEALELQLISLELDLCMAEVMRRRDLLVITEADYACLYQACDRREERLRQINLIRKLGHELEALTRMPLLLSLVKAVRKPAVAAGFGALQSFLEQGLSAFRQMQDPHHFVECIYHRETELMQGWQAGKPVNNLGSINC
jgi:hypothetical protein